MSSTDHATRLSRERILSAALALADRGGLDALSMRRLAQELDVWPMSIYRYFQDKEALLDALGDAAAERIAPPGDRGSWRSQLSRLLGRARAVFATHPAGSRLRLRGGSLTPAAAEIHHAGMGILTRAGFGPEEAERAWAALLSYTAGAAALETDDAGFEYGLERLLDGLEARLS
jgi:AcrR family transcriptional regulator